MREKSLSIKKAASFENTFCQDEEKIVNRRSRRKDCHGQRQDCPKVALLLFRLAADCPFKASLVENAVLQKEKVRTKVHFYKGRSILHAMTIAGSGPVHP